MLAAGVGGFYFYLRSSLPQVAGRLVLTGPKAEITIARDRDGVPLITASDDDDLAFGLGFAHAQDRLFQMELLRRYGAGRLAEIFGPEALAIDRQMRVLGLYHAAEAEIAYLSPEVRRGLEAYAAGVNAYLATRQGALPPEFLLLRFAPGKWRPADSLVWGKVMALQLEGDYRNELVRARLAATIPAADMAVLYPRYPKDAPTTLSALLPIYRGLALDRLYRALPALVGPHFASDNWVVDGKHSGSGKPLLANDPHLAFGAPGVWYLARLKTPAREIAGATAPGVPLVVIGHNDRIAWGFTTTTSDVEDLFIEKVDPADPGHYLTPQGSAPFATRRETIRVKGAAPVELTVRTTRHGPVVSDILSPGSAAPGYVLALAATFTMPDDRSAEALWRIDRAGDWASFRKALEDFIGPQQNMVYADVDGTIGFIAPGRVPIRAHGDGWLPQPGWTGDWDWTGFIPFAALPSAANPRSGHFFSANNKIVPDGYPYYLGRGWDLPNRAERIAALLAATPIQTPATSTAMQADTYSLMAARLVPLMTKIVAPPADGAALGAIAALQHWDFHMDGTAIAPTLFTAWLREFSHRVLFGRFGEAIADYWNLRPDVMEAVLSEHPDWCGTPAQPAKDCALLLGRSLDAAVAGLRRDYGSDIGRWQWGRVHQAVFANPVFSHIPVLRDWLTPSIPAAGAYDTLNRGPTTIRNDAEPFTQRYGAGLRMIIDLADPAAAQMIVTPGQSGNPLSHHWDDLMPRWRDFRWLTPGRAVPVATLTLAPAQ